MAKEKTPLKWKFKTGDSVSSDPAVSEGMVYFGSNDNHLYAVDSKTGEEKWKFKTKDYVSSSPAVKKYKPVGFGRYADPETGEIVAKMQDGKLVPV